MKNGPYILVIAPPNYPGKRYRSRYCYEHHLIWWTETGQLPEDGYLIHHKDHNKHNNDFSNLELISVTQHNQLHHTKTTPNASCHLCAKPLIVRPYRIKSGKPIFCSRQHSGKFYSNLYWNGPS